MIAIKTVLQKRWAGFLADFALSIAAADGAGTVDAVTDVGCTVTRVTGPVVEAFAFLADTRAVSCDIIEIMLKIHVRLKTMERSKLTFRKLTIAVIDARSCFPTVAL